MLKKRMAAILIAALALCGFIPGAAAAQYDEDWSDLSFTMTDLPSGEEVSYRGDCGIPTVLLFGGIGTCYNTFNFIQYLLDLSDQFEPGAVQVFLVDLRGITAEKVDYMFEEVGVPQDFYIGVEGSIKPASPLRRILDLANGGSYGFTMPAVAFLDADGRVKEICMGDISKLNILSGLSRIGVTSVHKTSVDILLRGRFRQTEARRELAMVNDLRTNDAWYWNPDNETKTVRSDLQPLVYDYALEQVAMQRAVELAVSYDHTRPDGSRFTEAYNEMGYAFSSAGENIACGQLSAEQVQTAWEEARWTYEGQGHRRNMLNAGYRAFGCACFEFEGVLYWVQEFSGAVVSGDEVPANDSETDNRVAIPVSAVTGWYTAPETLEMKAGETVDPNDLIALFLTTKYDELESAEAPKWRSADTGLLRADADGRITALAEGETAITATLPSQNGNWTVAVNITIKGTAPFAAEKAAFDACKAQADKTAAETARADDSEESIALIDAARAAIAALAYDETKTAEENNAAVDAILAGLTAALSEQRAADLLAKEREAFEAHKTELLEQADAMALADDSAACRELIEAAKDAIVGMVFNEELPPLYNIAAADELLAELRRDLTVQRKADARLPGDVNGNGRVEAEDARLALRASVGLETYAEGSAAFLAADVNRNGKPDPEDARRILRASVGLEQLPG